MKKASLYTRDLKSGRHYYGNFYDPTRKPKQKRIALGTKDRSTARRRLTKWERLWEDGQGDPWDGAEAMQQAAEPKKPDAVPVEQAIQRFADGKEQAGRAPATVKMYRGILGRFAAHIGTETPFADVSASDVRSFLYAGDVAQSTRKKRYRHVRAFLRWAKKQELTERRVMERVDAPKVPKREPVAITGKELKRLCQTIATRYTHLIREGNIREGDLMWKSYAFQFSYLTGLRRSELVRLKWKDVDFQRQSLHLRTQKNKTEQRLPIAPAAVELVRELAPRRLLERREAEGEEVLPDTTAEDAAAVSIGGLPGEAKEVHPYFSLYYEAEPSEDLYVFRSPHYTKTKRSYDSAANDLSRTFKQFKERAKLRGELTLHSLRAGFCSALARAGKSAMTIKQLARHSAIATSMKYVKMHEDHGREALNDVFG